MMTEIPAVRGFIRMCTDGWEQGWHERNGGNLTYRMKPEEVEQCRPFFTAPREWNSMGVQADNLKGEYFITTGSGKFLRNVQDDPEHNIGIVEINDVGGSWRIVWGLENGARPTSEFPSHFMNHSAQGGDERRLPRHLPRAHAESHRDDVHHAADGARLYACFMAERHGVPGGVPRRRGRGAVDGAGRRGHCDGDERTDEKI